MTECLTQKKRACEKMKRVRGLACRLASVPAPKQMTTAPTLVYTAGMKTRAILLLATLAAASPANAAEESPAVELFAGWSFFPYPYYGYGYPGPYGYTPFLGVGMPLNRCFADPLPPYACGFYDPYWGYDYGVRYRVWPNAKRLHTPESAGPYIPGAAPTEPLANTHKTEWDLTVERFLKTPLGECGAPTNDAARATNASVHVEASR